MVKNLYALWMKIDETVPWIELKGKYQTREEAKKAAEEIFTTVKIKIVKISEGQGRAKVLATTR